MPVFNIEEYIDRCVESILRQTYPNVELILVDDGSTDSCPAICDRYQQAKRHITVVHQRNQGLSAARNAGTAVASGEYITFIDGDDFVRETFIGALFEALRRNNAQIAVCGMASITDSTPCSPARKERGAKAVYSGQDALPVMLYQKMFDISACGKLFRTEDVRKVSFPVGRVYEDIVPVTQLIGGAERVVWLPERMYCYYQRQGSIVHSSGLAARRDELDMTDEMYAFVSRTYPEAEPAALCKRFSNYCQVLAAVQRNGRDASARQMRKRVMSVLWECAPHVMRDSRARYKNRLAALLLCIASIFTGEPKAEASR